MAEVVFFFSSPISKKTPQDLAVPADGRVRAPEPLSERSFPMKRLVLMK
jgi:hypothetical protein